MKDVIKLIAEIVNVIHDVIMNITSLLGFRFTGKVIQFWVIGIIGIAKLNWIQVLFKILSTWSLTVISLFYTITVPVVVVFSIEILQRLHGE